ncbi:MAG TPA: type VII secretion target [Pilimelia sp.]|nr:type VII secretion target [Pilimelia sp.]
MTGLRIPPDEVRGHARCVDDAAAAVGEALAGVGFIRLHPQVYGQLVGPLVAATVEEIGDLAAARIREAESAVQRLADGLRSMADRLDGADAAAAARVRGAR